MKKTYSKPQIMFEAFTLSTNIAAGCGLQTKLQDKNGGCGWRPDERAEAVFNFGVQGSQCEVGPGEMYNELCYDNPYGEYALFTS